MPRMPLRETIFDSGCSLAGRVGRALGQTLSRPVFIVGTGRCGTSVFVEVLKSHRGLSGFPAEANELWHPALEPFETARLPTEPIEVDPALYSQISLAHWPSNHGARIRDVFTGFHLLTGRSKLFFTKSAMVSFLIPTILQLFPDARIIHIYRYGPSVVESYFKKNFGKYSRFRYTERDYEVICARYWNSCILKIDEDTRALSKHQFLEFSYERMCQNPHGVLDDVALFLGVQASGFRFDTSELSNQNFKAKGKHRDSASAELLAAMSPGLALKGYSSE